MKAKKFDVLTVPFEVEYIFHLARRLFSLLAWVMLLRVKKFNITMNNQPVFSFYRLIIPRILKGGGADAE